MRRLWLVPLLALLFPGVGLARVARMRGGPRNTQTKLVMADGSPVPTYIQRAVSRAHLPTAAGTITLDWLAPTTTYDAPGKGGTLDPSNTYTAKTRPLSAIAGANTISLGPAFRNPGVRQQRRVLRALGHAFDYTTLNNAERHRAASILGLQGRWMGQDEPYQTFADVYQYAAEGKKLKPRDWRMIGPTNTVVTGRQLSNFERFVHRAFAQYVHNGGKLPGDDTLQS